MKVNNHKDSVDISQLGRSKRAEKNPAVNRSAAQKEAAESAPSVGVASVELSDEAKAMASANQIAKADSTDQAKIDRIKAMIQSGSYQPDFGKVADKMTNELLLQENS